jgi:hypothetical protein
LLVGAKMLGWQILEECASFLTKTGLDSQLISLVQSLIRVRPHHRVSKKLDRAGMVILGHALPAEDSHITVNPKGSFAFMRAIQEMKRRMAITDRSLEHFTVRFTDTAPQLRC